MWITVVGADRAAMLRACPTAHSASSPPGQRRVAGEWRDWWLARTAEDDPALQAAAEQGFVLHVNELGGLGISRQRARTLLRRGSWQAPRRGVVAPLAIDTPGTDDFLIARRAHALAATAEALVHRDHVVSATSGAVLHGLPVVAQLSRPILTSAIPDNLGTTGRALVRGAELFAEDVTNWFGAPVTMARTVIDMARLDRRDGIAAADAALREGAGIAGRTGGGT